MKSEKYLIVNPGSTSKKYALYDGGVLKSSVICEKKADSYFLNSKKGGREISEKEFVSATDTVVSEFIKQGICQSKQDLKAIVLRVVAMGQFFTEHKIVDQEFISQLHDERNDSSIHVRLVLWEIENIKKDFKDVAMIGISDSAFHKNIPVVGKSYALPQEDSRDLDIYKFGYHGISLQSIVTKLKSLKGSVPEKMIIAHMGGGISLTALKDGISIDTSMGMTPIEGVPMSTRVGDIDPGAVAYIAHRKKLNLESTKKYLNSRCGLLGLSGLSGDARVLLREEQNNPQAKLALEKLVYSVKKYIGAYASILNGLDMVVFTGAMGERSVPIRKRILSNMEFLGISLDEDKNNKELVTDPFIQDKESKVEIAVLETNELEEMYNQAIKIEI